MSRSHPLFPSTVRRVALNTAPAVNRRIARRTETNVAYYASHPHRIDQRLAELDREWDIERLLEANAATVAFTGVALAAFAGRRWLALPAVVSAFLFQHATQGWCPPLALFRRLGVRTAAEIDRERAALKLLRGDYRQVAEEDREEDCSGRAQRILRAVGR